MSARTSVLAFAILIAPLSSQAQVAIPHLYSRGTLTSETSNIAPIEKGTARVYAGSEMADGDVEYKSDLSTDRKWNVLYLAIDAKVGNGMVAGGYETGEFKEEATVNGIEASQEATRNRMAFDYSVDVEELGVFSVRAFLVNLSSRLSASNSDGSGESLSGSVAHQYFDVSFGARFDLEEPLKFGFVISPAVASNVNYVGDFAGFQSRVGHGDQFQVGIGATISEQVAGGFDLYRHQEHQESLSASRTGILAAVELKVGERFVASGEFNTSSADKLEVNGDLYAPEQFTLLFGISFHYDVRPESETIVGLGIFHGEVQASDTGDDAFDAGRFDQFEFNSIEITISTAF